MLSTVGDDQYEEEEGEDDESSEDEGAVSPIPDWIFNKQYEVGTYESEMVRQHKNTREWKASNDPIKQNLIFLYRSNLVVQGKQFNFTKHTLKDVQC